MTSRQIARVDGLPMSLVRAQRVWPTPYPSELADGLLSAAQRARIARQTAGVHQCRVPAWAQGLLAELVAEQERTEIRSELRQAGLL